MWFMWDGISRASEIIQAADRFWEKAVGKKRNGSTLNKRDKWSMWDSEMYEDYLRLKR